MLSEIKYSKKTTNIDHIKTKLKQPKEQQNGVSFRKLTLVFHIKI